jgi:predicted flap endonuclease-1-like 5' DNA nuclease
LQGVGAKTADTLHEAGIRTFEALAAHTEEEIRDRAESIPPFANVESWIEQADART